MDATRPVLLARPPEPSFAELFTPKLVTVLREGYGFKDLRADLIAGLGGGTAEGYPEDAGSVPAGFLFNGAL